MTTLCAPVFVIHALDHAVAALAAAAEAGCPIVLASAPGAAIYAGPAWWRGMLAAARAKIPAARCLALLDCGEDAGAAQAALRAGVEAVAFAGRPDVAVRLAAIAAQAGALFLTERPAAALDLAELCFADPDSLQRRCAQLLASAAFSAA